MRQFATAHDGTGYEIRECLLVAKEDEDPRRAVMLFEDGAEVGSDGNRRPFDTFAQARDAAYGRTAVRRRGAAELAWRTET